MPKTEEDMYRRLECRSEIIGFRFLFQLRAIATGGGDEDRIIHLFILILVYRVLSCFKVFSI